MQVLQFFHRFLKRKNPLEGSLEQFTPGNVLPTPRVGVRFVGARLDLGDVLAGGRRTFRRSEMDMVGYCFKRGWVTGHSTGKQLLDMRFSWRQLGPCLLYFAAICVEILKSAIL